MAKQKEISYSLHLIDRATGECREIEEIPEEVKKMMAQRLGCAMSDYYAQHPEEYAHLPTS